MKLYGSIPETHTDKTMNKPDKYKRHSRKIEKEWEKEFLRAGVLITGPFVSFLLILDTFLNWMGGVPEYEPTISWSVFLIKSAIFIPLGYLVAAIGIYGVYGTLFWCADRATNKDRRAKPDISIPKTSKAVSKL